jgi:hypothetical protein
MKHTIFFITVFMALAAQAQDAPKIEQMHLRKWKCITDHCKLSPQESEQVKALFLEYEEAQWKMMEEFKQTLKAIEDKKNETKDFDYEKFNETVVNIDLKKARLFRNYYQKLKTVLSAETIFCFFEAERKFRKELIKEFRPPNEEHKAQEKNHEKNQNKNNEKSAPK